MHRILFLTLIALMSFSLPAFSGPGDGADDGVVDPFGAPPKVVSFRTLWNVDGARPGDEVILGIVATMDGGFHINADAAQQPPIEDFDPIPTRITVIEASENLNLEVRFPRPHGVTAEYLDGELMAFEGETVFYLPVRLDEDFVGDRVRVTVEIHFQACDNTQCLMPDSEVVSAALPVLAGGATPTPANASFFADVPSAGGGSDRVTFDLFRWTFSVDAASNSGLLLLWVVALFGGFLLNFTPCVLPVIPIKIMSLSNTAGSRGRTLALGVAMFLGIIGFWLALGLVISSVSGFTATNQLFQYPAFSITVGTIIAIMAVGMTGVFYMQLPQAVYQLNPSQESLHGSFGLGIMTAILSTPCTAPFMGAAAVWAAGQSPVITLTTFAAIGLGMGLPYFLLSAFPRLVSRMPRTGPGSELLKQVLGIFMLAAAAYFVGVGLTALLITPPDPPSKFHWWVVMGILAAGGLWLAWRTFGITTRPGKRILFGGLGLMVATLAVMGGSTSPPRARSTGSTTPPSGSRRRSRGRWWSWTSPPSGA